MSRQLRTLAVGAVLCLVLGVVSFALRVPFLVLGPGPTFNTLGQDSGHDIIAIKGHAVAATSGHLNLTTVSTDTQDTTVAGAIRGWLAHDEVVVPRDSVYPPGVSEQQQNAQDAQDFTSSQDNATAAAACELKYPKGFGVIGVEPNSPNASVLHTGDAFVSLAGTPVADDTALRKVLAAHRAGDRLSAVVLRAGSRQQLTVTLGAPPSGSTTPRLGITVAQGCLLPFEVTLSLTGIGGPSAGLMFALGIIDKIGTDDLTRGRFIAGTGTIDPSGAVGPIGGIALKMIASKRAGASVFLAPAGNCTEVRAATPAGLNVVKVTSLHDAITSLDTLAAGGSVPRC